MSRALYVLGTGHAMVTRLYNTCFALRDGGGFFLLDGGGGNGILQAAEAMNIPWERVRHLFLSHLHTDHVLGGLWAVRAVGASMLEGDYGGTFQVWAHSGLLTAFRRMCEATLSPSIAALLDGRILLCPVEDGETAETEFGNTTFFDTGCASIRQFGCSFLRDGVRLTYLGDEPIRSVSRPWTQGCDYLITEALCLYSERELHHPYETLHSTVKDACENAETLGVKNLILCHTEDTHGPSRGVLYAEEGGRYYSGRLFIPDDRVILPIT